MYSKDLIVPFLLYLESAFKIKVTSNVSALISWSSSPLRKLSSFIRFLTSRSSRFEIMILMLLRQQESCVDEKTKYEKKKAGPNGRPSSGGWNDIILVVSDLDINR
jgi:hypothetical protein